MELNAKNLKQVFTAIAATEELEYTCEECYERIEKFVELEISGKTPEQAMPLVQRHLKVCRSCQEEYQVLLQAIQQLPKNTQL